MTEKKIWCYTNEHVDAIDEILKRLGYKIVNSKGYIEITGRFIQYPEYIINEYLEEHEIDIDPNLLDTWKVIDKMGNYEVFDDTEDNTRFINIEALAEWCEEDCIMYQGRRWIEEQPNILLINGGIIRAGYIYLYHNVDYIEIYPHKQLVNIYKKGKTLIGSIQNNSLNDIIFDIEINNQNYHIIVSQSNWKCTDNLPEEMIK